MASKKNWIAGAIKKPGALHDQLEVPSGKKIPAGKLAKAAQSGGKLGQRARLAETLKGMGKGKKTKGSGDMPMPGAPAGGNLMAAAANAAKQQVLNKAARR